MHYVYEISCDTEILELDYSLRRFESKKITRAILFEYGVRKLRIGILDYKHEKEEKLDFWGQNWICFLLYYYNTKNIRAMLSQMCGLNCGVRCRLAVNPFSCRRAVTCVNPLHPFLFRAWQWLNFRRASLDGNTGSFMIFRNALRFQSRITTRKYGKFSGGKIVPTRCRSFLFVLNGRACKFAVGHHWGANEQYSDEIQDSRKC